MKRAHHVSAWRTRWRFCGCMSTVLLGGSVSFISFVQANIVDGSKRPHGRVSSVVPWQMHMPRGLLDQTKLLNQLCQLIGVRKLLMESMNFVLGCMFVEVIVSPATYTMSWANWNVFRFKVLNAIRHFEHTDQANHTLEKMLAQLCISIDRMV